MLAVAMAVALTGCGGAAGGSSRPPHRDLESIFEAEVQLHADPAGTIKHVRALGAGRLRVYVAWNGFAPQPASHARPTSFRATDPAAYPASAWSLYDQTVRVARQQGLALDFTVGGPPPLWAASAGAPPGGPYPQWKPSAQAFGEFVQAVATRYSGSYRPAGAASPLPRVSFWSIWNEPNYGPQLAPQATQHSTVEVAPMLYRNLLDAAWNALQSTGHGSDTILIGETAPRGLTTGNSPGNFSGMVPLRFLRALYCVDSAFNELRATAAALRGCPTDAAGSQRFPRLHPVLFRAGGFAAHPYPQGLPPNVATPDEPDYADLPALPRLEQTLDHLQRLYGSHAQLPIYDTEYGYQTDPPEKIARSVDPATAAYYLNWGEYVHWRDPRVRSYDQYQLTDPPLANALGGFATGLEYKDGVPKPSYDAFRMPLYLPLTSAKRGQSLEVWGCVRPAPYAQRQTGASQQVSIEFRPLSAPRFTALRTLSLSDPHGYFDLRLPLRESGQLRLAWSYPGGPAIHSRVVSVTVK